MQNLSKRPFMVISYNYVLTAGQKSNSKGFGATAQWEPVENMVIVDRVTNKMLLRAELVMDLFNHKVIKCRDADINQAEIFDIFVSRHYEDVKQALATWITNDPANLDKVKSFVERFKKEETNANPELPAAS